MRRVERVSTLHQPGGALYKRDVATGLNWVARYEEVLRKGMKSDFHHTDILQHHSWQQACKETGAKAFGLCLSKKMFTGYAGLKSKLEYEKTKFISITHASNVLGVVNPIKLLD